MRRSLSARLRRHLGCWLPLLLLTAGCSEPPKPSNTAAQRVIALAPNVVEILYALGAGDELIAVGDYCRWPPEVEDKPRVGGLLNPNLELIVSLEPELAVLLDSERELAGPLQRLGIEVLSVPNDSLADIEASIQTIAGRLGRDAEGERLVEQLRTDLAPKAAPEGMLTVLSVGRTPGPPAELLVVGPDTFLDELLARAGGRNAFADAPVRYSQISLEEVLARAPELIVELQSGPLTPAQQDALRTDWNDFPEIPAVRDSRIEVISGDHVLIPGPRLTQLYGQLQQLLDDEP